MIHHMMIMVTHTEEIRPTILLMFIIQNLSQIKYLNNSLSVYSI